MLTVLTWNIWFGGHRFEERSEALVQHIGRAGADLVALQEVTPELLPWLRAAPWAGDYEFSDADEDTLGDYGSLILSRLPVARVAHHPLTTQMGRQLVVADVALDATRALTFATVHLESLGESETRALQLGEIFPRLARRAEDALFVGDMNFAEGAEPETTALDPAFADVWRALRPREPGYTVDTDRNRMRWLVKEKRAQRRIDRMFLRSPAGRVRPRSIRLYGDAPIGGDPELFVSDHFGLLAEFEVG